MPHYPRQRHGRTAAQKIKIKLRDHRGRHVIFAMPSQTWNVQHLPLQLDQPHRAQPQFPHRARRMQQIQMGRKLRHADAPRHQIPAFQQRPIKSFTVERYQHRTLRNARSQFQQHRMLLGKIAHHELLDLQSTRIPPGNPDQKRIRSGSARQPGRLGIQEKPFLGIFRCGTPLSCSCRVCGPAKYVQRCGRNRRKLRCRVPVANA